MRPRSKPSARALLRARSASSTPPRWAAAPAPLPGADASSSVPRQPRRWSARRWDWRLPHTALAPSGQPIWLDAARRSARAILRLHQLQIGTSDILTQAAIQNAMVVHAAFGGSTNLLLHVPAIAFAAKLRRPVASDWAEVNRQVPRLVDALPNGPRNFATVQVFLAGGVPEVMLHLRRAGLLDTSVKTVSGETLATCLDWWQDEPSPPGITPLPAGAGRHRSGRRDYDARSGAVERNRFDHLFSRGQSGAGGLRHQEHRHRSFAHRRERRLSACRSGQSFHHGSRRDSGHQERRGRARRRDRAHLRRSGRARACRRSIRSLPRSNNSRIASM